ncbi:MAG: hypothetical protein NZ484_02030 [Patescibacteria group bacterium]|nr:hypothetical protein [Patescibacteria group bacterium]MCX7589668.1 hypothetical protein [Patescibacteria group bacterium]MDW8279555.1 hypothetical protein [bacterium]
MFIKKNNIYKSLNQKGEKINRPWIITLFCFTGTLWLFLIFLGIIGLISILKNNFNIINLIKLFLEISLFIVGIIALRLYWLMKKKAVFLLGIAAGIEMGFNFLYGIWPLSLSCGCDFPIILTILGILYYKKMN